MCACAHIYRLYKLDVSGNLRAMMKLMNSADVAKHSLSTLGSSNCFVDSLYDGMDFECNVSRYALGPPACQGNILKHDEDLNALLVHRARFELICSNLFSKSIQPIRKLLEQVDLSTSDVNKVMDTRGSHNVAFNAKFI